MSEAELNTLIQKSSDKGMIEVALYEPENPLNAGSIARTCVCAGCPLHLIGILGFKLDNKIAKRAGLDYWELAELHVHKKWEDFTTLMADRRMWFFSTKGRESLWDADFTAGDLLVFGSERSGLPGKILHSGMGHIVRIPMLENRRSLNLSNAVAIAVYEALRQISSPSAAGKNPG
jgi:tRNA (cytidine/uridine-2'-O-)-methyltransferase